MMEDPIYRIGERVEDPKDGQRGTIMYVGPVPPTQGLWLGIEWDKPDTRGKHDGTHQGVKYFEPGNKLHPTPASFVRPAKVSQGISLCQAVMNRYGAVDGETAGVDEDMLGKLCKEIGAPFVTVVGFDKVNKQQSDFGKLRVIGLRRCRVANLGDNPDLIGSMLPRVQSLDLGENLISSWDTLVEIGKQLGKLKVLSVGDNKLSLPSDGGQTIWTAFPCLEQLVIGELGYTWDQVYTIASGLHNLLLLNCHGNLVSQIEAFDNPDIFSNLVELNLNGNPLGDWALVLKFRQLPKLRTLFINDCKIRSIYFNLDDGLNFPSLRCLCMTYNEINDWISFANLDCLNLTDLRCRNNPILDSEKQDTARQILIASIGSLAILNGTEIERTERYGADIDYLKRYGLEYHKAVKEGTLESFETRYPRYLKLVSKYGVIDEEELKVKDTSLKATLISVTIDCPEVPKFVKLTKKLPPTMTIQKLRLLLQRSINRKSEGALSHKFVLSAASEKQPEIHVPLDNDMRDLFFYSVETGDTISVKW